MMAWIARRAIHGFFLLIAVSVFSFALLSIAPGNFFDELKLNPQISADTVSALKAEYGAGRPFPVRYWRWLTSALQGEFGYSMAYRRPVSSLLWLPARNTLLLTMLATLLAWMVALACGTLQALHQRGWFDRTATAGIALLVAVPEVVIALLLLLLAAQTGWFPTGGMNSVRTANAGYLGRVGDVSRHLILPLVALVLGALPPLVRHVRSSMVTALGSPFILAARGHGISRGRLILRYALPAASNSVISLMGFSIGALASMSLLVEVVMNWPGLGPLVLEAVLSRDVHVVIAVVMLSSLFLIAGNFVADVLLYWSDPRIRLVAHE